MKEYLLRHPDGLQLAFSDFGATWLSCRLPLADGSLRELSLRHARLEHYISEGGCLGGTMGRYANRIGGACFRSPEGPWVQLPANEGLNTCHGGPIGFHRRPWRVEAHSERELVFGLHSPHGDQGFTGALDIVLRVELRSAMRVRLSWFASLDAAARQSTPMNLTNHVYFNLDGGGDARRQRLRIVGSHWLPTDPDLIPTGEVCPVDGTPFDLRQGRSLDAPIDAHPDLRMAGGYDHCWLLDQPEGLAAELRSHDGRVALQLRTSSPALQLYSGQYLGDLRIQGKPARPFQALALEPQFPPDAPNHPEWPAHLQPWVAPGQCIEHWMDYQFEVFEFPQ